MSKIRQVTILFPELPYSELNPNNLRRTHWGVRSSVSGIAREEAYLLGKNAVRFLPNFKTFQHCEIEEVFIVPTLRQMDIEGQMAASKPWIDGLVDAGILVNDDWKHVHKVSGRIKYEKGVEKTEITIREAKG